MDQIEYLTLENTKVKTAEWMEQIIPYNFRDVSPNIKDSALLVIDMQEFFLTPGKPVFTPSGLNIIPKIKKIQSGFRNMSRPIIYLTQGHKSVESDRGILAKWWSSTLLESNPEARVHTELSPLDNEKIIVKRRYSGFYQTDLELTLRCLNVKELVITGIMSNICCESTARDGFFRDFGIFFVADATASINEELHLSTLRNIALGFGKVLTTEEVLISMVS